MKLPSIMLSDLHTHSVFSDGTSTPEEVVALAAKAHINVLALTDHNTTEGYTRFANACKEHGITGIQGVEIDCQEPETGYYSELLAYFPEGNAEDIETVLVQKREARTERVERALCRASEYFGRNDLSMEELRGLALRENGFIRMLSNKLTYRYFLSKGISLPDYPVCQEASWWKGLWSMKGILPQYTLFKTTEIVRNAGGFPVLPHFGFCFGADPVLMGQNRKRIIALLKKMKGLGLWGVELHPYRSNKNAPAINRLMAQWAQETGLHLTSGSDYHGGISAHGTVGYMCDTFKGF